MPMNACNINSLVGYLMSLTRAVFRSLPVHDVVYFCWWHSQQTFPGLRHDMQLTPWSKPSAVCQPTCPTQPFILLGLINE